MLGSDEARNPRLQGKKEEKKKEAFIIRQSFDNIGRELISLVATTLREIGKQEIEAPTKADTDICSCTGLQDPGDSLKFIC